MKNTLLAFLITSPLLLTSCATTDDAERTGQPAPEVKDTEPKPKEVWKCFDNSDLITQKVYGTTAPVLVTATVGPEKASGKVHVAGVMYDAVYSVKGFIRKWNFGHESPTEYMFTIKPDGKGSYYEGANLLPSIFMECKRSN